MAQGADPTERHQAEAYRLRSEIEELVRQARALLYGEDHNRRFPPRPAAGKRADRQNELEAALEKADWYRRDIKRLRRELESSYISKGPAEAKDRDPMEVHNLLCERRQELQRIQRSGEGLDRVAAAQRRAEAAQNALTPEIEDRLRRTKDEVEQQKRLNIRLQHDRPKVVNARKKVEEEVRAMNGEVRSKAAKLQRPGRPVAAGYDAEPGKIRQLRRDVDILTQAVHQDERKYKASQREDEQQLEFMRRHAEKLQDDIGHHEAEIRRVRAEIRGEDPEADVLSPSIASARSVAAKNGLAENMEIEDVLRNAFVAKADGQQAEAVHQHRPSGLQEVEPEPEARLTPDESSRAAVAGF